MKPSRTVKRLSIGVAIALALYALIGFLIVPPVARAQILKRLPPILHREVSLGQVRVNPFALSVTLRDFAVREKDGSNFVSFAELYVNVAYLRLFIGQIRFEEIRLVQPHVDVALLKGGRLSFADLLEGPEKPPSKEPPPRIHIEKLRIDAGEVGFADLQRSQPFRARFQPIQLALDNFSTAPEANSPYTFTARMDPSTVFRWKGDLSATPFHSEGTIEIEGIALAAFAPYLREQTRLELRQGSLAVKLRYKVDASKEPVVVQLQDGSLQVRELRVGAPGKEAALLSLPLLSLTGLHFDLGARRAAIGAVSLEGGAVNVLRRRDGKLEWAELAGPPAGASAAPEEKAAAPFRVELGGLKLSRFSIDVEDQAPGRPGKLRVSELALDVGAVAHPSDAPIDVGLSLRLDGGGSLSVKGKARPSGAAEVEVALDQLSLPALQPWIAEEANAVLTSGLFALHGKARYAPRGKKEPELAFDGAFALDKLSVASPGGGREVAGWEALSVTGISFRGPPRVLRIEKIALQGPRGHAVKAADGKMNLAGLAKESPPPKEKPAPLQVALGAFTIDRGAFDYTDRAMKPPFAVRISQLKARALPLHWPEPAKTKFEVTGRLDAAPFALRGEVHPKGKAADLDAVVTLKGWDLPPTSPCSLKYTGYPVTKGKLSLDLKYKIEKRQLEGANLVLVDQPTLGDHQDIEGATGLPVKLALAILTDRHGLLKVDLPVSGNLDDPSFRFGGVIVAALVNLLTKVATSPFALIGGLFSSDEDPSNVDFEPGTSDLAEKEKAKLAKVAQALLDRPGLRMEVVGSVDFAADRAALSLAALRERLNEESPLEYPKRLRAAWLASQPPPPAGKPPPPEPSDAEMEKALAAKEAVPDQELAELAEERAREVQELLLGNKGLEPERVFVVAEKLDAAAAKAQAKLKPQ